MLDSISDFVRNKITSCRLRDGFVRKEKKLFGLDVDFYFGFR
jgi:hypothetical protein